MFNMYYLNLYNKEHTLTSYGFFNTLLENYTLISYIIDNEIDVDFILGYYFDNGDGHLSIKTLYSYTHKTK
jgi:hypothetical protein